MSRKTCVWIGVFALALLALFPPVPTRAAGGKGGKAIRGGEIVVRLKKGASITRFNFRQNTATMERLADSSAFRLRLPRGGTVEDHLAKALIDPDVELAQPNYEIHYPELLQSSQAFIDPAPQRFVLGTSPLNFFSQGAAQILRISQAHSVNKGSGVTVAVIDTGIDLSHPLFAGKIAWPAYDFVDGDGDPSEVPGTGFGHGTFVSGLILLGAPGASIMPIRAFDGNGVGTSFTVAKSIRFAAQHGARVINMSFGMFEEDPLIEDVLDEVDDRVVMVAAAGNDGMDFLQFPADESDALSVTATTVADLKAPFANFESDVSVSAPGVDLYSSYPGGLWGTWHGTSFSTALVSAEAALLIAMAPSFSRSDVMNIITEAGVKIDSLNPYYEGRIGKVRVDFYEAVIRALR